MYIVQWTFENNQVGKDFHYCYEINFFLKLAFSAVLIQTFMCDAQW